MTDLAASVSNNLGIWTSAIERKSGAGRGGGKRISLYGIARLRALIIDLAIRGKLLPQNASDEPASELLKHIAKCRALIAKRMTQVPTRSVPSSSGLRIGWQSVSLDNLAYPQAGFAFKSKDFNEQGIVLPLIRICDVGQPFTGTFFSGDRRP